MATIDLGKVSITPRGTWDAATAYEPLDVVLYGGSSYIAIAETLGNPPTDARYFSLLAAKGEAGEATVTKENIKSVLGYTAADARSLAALWKLSQGVVYDFETDATEAYAKTVPTGAKACTVKRIGGKCEVIDGEILSADVESVLYNDAVVSDIPTDVRSLPGYGWSAGTAYNSIERTDEGRWLFVQRVGSVDLGTLEWYYADSAYENLKRFQTEGLQGKIKAPIADTYSVNALTSMYSAGQWAYLGSAYDKFICCHLDGRFVIRDTEIGSLNDFINKVSGVMLYYELAEPVTTDITDLMTDALEPFAVEASGTITFRNSALLDVPSNVEYVIKLSEVNAS